MPSYTPQTAAPANGVTFHNWPGPGEAAAEQFNISHACVIPPGASVIHVGGQIGLSATGVPEDIEDEITEAFRHIEITLREAGLTGSTTDVWGCVLGYGFRGSFPFNREINTYHANTDAKFAPAFVKVLKAHCGTNRPIFTGVDVHKLFMPNLHIEIEVQAFLPAKK